VKSAVLRVGQMDFRMVAQWELESDQGQEVHMLKVAELAYSSVAMWALKLAGPWGSRAGM